MLRAIATSVTLVASLAVVVYSASSRGELLPLAGMLAWGAAVLSGRLVVDATPLRDRPARGHLVWVLSLAAPFVVLAWGPVAMILAAFVFDGPYTMTPWQGLACAGIPPVMLMAGATSAASRRWVPAMVAAVGGAAMCGVVAFNHTEVWIAVGVWAAVAGVVGGNLVAAWPYRARPRWGVCSGCGYDLSGLSVRARCPECGRKG